MSLNIAPCLPVTPSDDMRRKVTFWIRSFNPAERKLEAIVDSYVRLSTTQHCWAIDVEPGILLARIGGYTRAHYYLVDNGVLSVFEESGRIQAEVKAARTHPRPQESLGQWMRDVPGRVRSGDIPLYGGSWMLSSFCSFAKRMATECGANELSSAFSENGERAGGSIRMNKAHAVARNKYHLSRIGSTLKHIRNAMPKDVVARLWSMQLYDGRFARWVEDGNTSREYRLQALKAQPFLLPCALYYTGLLVPLKNSGDKENQARNWMWTQTNLNTGLMIAEIDAGRPWARALACALTNDALDEDRIAMATRHVQLMAGKTAASTLSVPAWQKRGGKGHHASPLRVVAMAHSLSGNRRPVNRKGWLLLSKLQHALGAVGQASHSWDSFLKGMPMDWGDPEWQESLTALSGLNDSVGWLAQALQNQEEPVRVPRDQLATALRERLTLKQLIGWTQRMHALYNQVEAERRANREDEVRKQSERYRKYKWPAAWPNKDFTLGKLSIVELTDAGQLGDEEAALAHCVGSYAHSCCNGRSRIFSVRDAQGAPMSTFELGLIQAPNKPVRIHLVQHRAWQNREPDAAAKRAVRGFLAQARKEDSEFALSWPSVPSPSGNQYQMNNIDALGPVVLEATQRAFPKLLAHVRALPTEPGAQMDEDPY